MYDHIGLHVRDLDRSVAFYESVLAPFGYERCSRDASSASFGSPNTPALYLYLSQDPAGTGTHIALRAQSASIVRKFHAAGLRAGGVDNGAPGVRVDYAPSYYAAFLLDPDRNNVEAVCMQEP